MSKTYTEIVASMKVNLGRLRTDMDTTEGTIISDIFEAIADDIEDVYVDIEHNGVVGSFRYWDKMSDEELEDLAYNYGLTRQAAIQSSGTVYFRTATQPTQDILIPEETVVTTEPDSQLAKISFVTTSERTMLFDNISSYYNSSTGYWEIAVPVRAVTAGISGNVGVGAIKLLEGSISGIDDVYNTAAFTNGQDEESNEDFADRCLLALRGVAIGTETAYIAKAMENVYVYDALVVGPGDTLMTRDNGLGGKLDIYIKIDKNSTDVYTQTTDAITYTASTTERILPNQPVKEIVSVVGSTSGTLVENTDWKYTQDTSVYKGSTSAVDKIEFLTSLTVGETVTITYTYFSIMTTLDAAIETVRPITADVLVKLADEVQIDVTALITAASTITDEATLRTSVQSAVQTFLTFKNLNGAVEQADVLEVIKDVTGVDNIRIPLDKLARAGLSGTSDIDLTEREYPTPGTVTINST
jgi:hypothetical protein